jgi:hypothetical protein
MTKPKAPEPGGVDLTDQAIVADRGGVLFDENGQLPRDLVIEWPRIVDIKPYPDNPRIAGDAIADVVASLRAFGWQQPIVVDVEGVIIVGHSRYYAALDLQQTNVPVYVARRLTPALAVAYRIADNKTHERSQWDKPKLLVEFDKLASAGLSLTLTAFRVPEIERLRTESLATPTPTGSAGPGGAPTYKCPECGYEWSGKS